ncbi:DNA-binding response OmpR family regulator [Paraburkholderia bannensis]|uniref:DNA-binding response OmpR family regulator n=1 Tax=Paraburkholderia bannensis TaxID=765414 RepID=A0A7W9WWL9_9BURK|nr:MULTISPECIES: response regulator [Paraburkholderia]MBB3261650.1 DNA-binding response OmpR family regulator [Paraburkholderia sp. WP4_3_2]MBB6106647.1 DNA-binding response OmpR family regulator [Paraburkholderia bannensis]
MRDDRQAYVSDVIWRSAARNQRVTALTYDCSISLRRLRMAARQGNTVSADKILVIEDDPAMRDLIVATLHDAGFAVSASLAAAHAGTAARVLVVDLGEPKTDGADNLRALRALHADARIVAISGRFRFNAATAASVAVQLGADRVLAKPLDCDALVANVRQLMGEPGQ